MQAKASSLEEELVRVRKEAAYAHSTIKRFEKVFFACSSSYSSHSEPENIFKTFSYGHIFSICMEERTACGSSSLMR